MGGIAVDRCDMSSRNRGLGGPTGSVWFHGEHVVYLFSMQESVAPGPASPRKRASIGAALIPAGIILMLAGLAGDLLANTLDPESARDGQLISFSDPNLWHLLLFGGVIVTAIGGIRWAVRQQSEMAGLIGGLMALLLIATVALGGWAAMRTSPAPAQAARAVAPFVPVIHDHANEGDAAGGGTVAGEGEGASSFGGHSHGEPGPVSPAQRVVLKQQLAEAKAASAKYRDIDVAKADGYFQVTQFIPGLGLHLANLKIPYNTFDPGKPQVLLYQPDANGDLKLAGVAYEYTHLNDTPPAGFAGGSDLWHYHNNLCFQKGGSVTIAKDDASCKAVGGLAFQQQTAWLLHAWIWTPNPDGVFTENNPNVA